MGHNVGPVKHGHKEKLEIIEYMKSCTNRGMKALTIDLACREFGVSRDILEHIYDKYAG